MIVGLLSLKTKNPAFQRVNEYPCIYTSTVLRLSEHLARGRGVLVVLEDAKGDTLGTIQTGYSIVTPPMFIFDLPIFIYYRLPTSQEIYNFSKLEKLFRRWLQRK